MKQHYIPNVHDFVVPYKKTGTRGFRARYFGGQCGRVKETYYNDICAVVFSAFHKSSNICHYKSKSLRQAKKHEILLYKLLGGE